MNPVPNTVTRSGLTLRKIGKLWKTRIRYQRIVHHLTLTADADESFIIARRAKKEIHAGRWAAFKASTSLRGPKPCTIGEILAWAQLHNVPRDYIYSFRNFLRRTGIQESDIARQPASILTDALVSQYKRAHETQASEAPDQLSAARIKRTANSLQNQARGVFARERLLDMKREIPGFPDLTDFLDSMSARRFKGVNRQRAPMPDANLIADTLITWLTLPDRNEFLAIGLELSCGLRIGEIAQARYDWIKDQQDPPALDGQASVKDHSGRLYVRPLDPWWRILLNRWSAEAWQPTADGYLLIGNPTERNEQVFKRISAWMRGLGWQTQKTNHAFRAYAGGLVTLKYGLYAAQAFLRHKSYTVTESNYSYLLDPSQRTMTPDQVPIQWAASRFTPLLIRSAKRDGSKAF